MFSSFDVHIIVDEIQKDYDILGMKVDKIYKINDEVRIKLYGKGRRDLILKPGKAIFLTSYPKSAPQNPSGFAMQLRKYLGGLRVMSLEQIGFDRLVKIAFGLYGGGEKEDVVKYYLIIELFGDGNLILADHELNIIGVLHAHNWSTRSLKAKQRYEPPPKMMSPFDVDMDELEDPNYEVVKLLATKMNIGGMYAEEICLRAGIDKTDRHPDKEKLLRGIDELIGLQKDPAVVDGNIVPFDLMIHKGRQRTGYKTLNEAADEVYGKKEMEQIASVQVSKKEKQLSKLERILSSQRETVEKYEKRGQDAQEKGDIVFENYQLVDKVLSTIYSAVKSLGWKEVDERLGRSDDGISQIIKGTSPKTGKITLGLSGRDVELDITKNINENAQSFYDVSKKMKGKLTGANKAIDVTLAKLEKMETSEVKVEEVKKREKRKREWYETYRWFYTSDGLLVIGGKDARTNETLVKRYLKDNDLHVHADIQGAPQVIIRGGNGASDVSLSEAGIFAVSFSRAWKMGVSGLDAYWVYPEQVTKEPPTGEFLAKGAFFIKGKKNYLRKMPLEIGIGIYENKIMCGPWSAVVKNCQERLRVTFGGLSKEEAGKRVKDLLKWEDMDEIIQALPPGNCDIKET